MQTRTAAQPDPVLIPFLRAAEGREAEQRLEELLRQADGTVREVLRAKLRAAPGGGGSRQSEEALASEDVHGEVVLQLVGRLRALKGDPGAEPITSFRGFAAVTAYRACSAYFRKKYPQRASLKNKLYSLLTRETYQKGLALWDGPGSERCAGFSAWRDAGRGVVRNDRYVELIRNPHGFAKRAILGESIPHMAPADLLARVFNWVGGPVDLDDLVAVVAELWGVRDAPAQREPAGDEGEPDPYDRVSDPRQDVAAEVGQRAYLQHLWSEIRQLPPRQCAALLLNLRDAQGRGVIALLPLRGIATLRQVAEALGLTPERFAEVWNELPLEDAVIAELLGCTRQQVINLRKVARERLARRMRAFAETP